MGFNPWTSHVYDTGIHYLPCSPAIDFHDFCPILAKEHFPASISQTLLHHNLFRVSHVIGKQDGFLFSHFSAFSIIDCALFLSRFDPPPLLSLFSFPSLLPFVSLPPSEPLGRPRKREINK